MSQAAGKNKPENYLPRYREAMRDEDALYAVGTQINKLLEIIIERIYPDKENTQLSKIVKLFHKRDDEKEAFCEKTSAFLIMPEGNITPETIKSHTTELEKYNNDTRAFFISLLEMTSCLVSDERDEWRQKVEKILSELKTPSRPEQTPNKKPKVCRCGHGSGN